MTAALAAAMLALGVGVGAAIGPAPSASQASSSLPVLLGSLARIAAARAVQSRTLAVQPPPVTAEATPTHKRRRKRRVGSGASSSAPTAPAPTSAPQTTAPKAPTPSSTTTPSVLPPVTHVWLIELTGSTFAAAGTQPAAAPYLDTQAIPAGALLGGWSSLEGGAFANEAALLAPSSPQLLDTIVQPPCAEGAPGAACATETPGALSAADEFLKTTVATITSTAAFRESGLIVVTFASVASATAAGLPAGAGTATLTAQPPAGVLLISPFVAVGARPTTPFNPTSPKRSLEGLLRR